VALDTTLPKDSSHENHGTEHQKHGLEHEMAHACCPDIVSLSTTQNFTFQTFGIYSWFTGIFNARNGIHLQNKLDVVNNEETNKQSTHKKKYLKPYILLAH
jgi:hypothetical protein